MKPLSECRFRVSLDTTGSCNISCRHCWMEELRSTGYSITPHTMSFELFKKIVNDVRPFTVHLNLSCSAEPLMNRDFEKYLRYAVDAGIPTINFITNGMLLNRERIREIVEIGVQTVTFSLEGATKESYEFIRRGAKFEKLIEVLQTLKDQKRNVRTALPRVHLNWCIMEHNLNEFRALLDLACDNGVASVTLLPYLKWNQSQFDIPTRKMEAKALATAIRCFREKCLRRGIRVQDEYARAVYIAEPAVNRLAARMLRGIKRPGNQVKCGQPWNMMNISCSGIVMPCDGHLTDRIYGDFKTQTLQEIWNGEPYQNLMRGLAGENEPLIFCQTCHNFEGNHICQSYARTRYIDGAETAMHTPSVIPTRSNGRAAQRPGLWHP